ncbi:MAG TPA: hypothetical protein VJK49_07650, partial [Candidatus Limnocylindrales bacterium]|nr:hypothetical protein [Candidatus Limnocylindrales bacterium]
LTVGAHSDRAAGDRPRPKRPEVLLASALTGAGVPELLGALDRREAVHRAAGADGGDAALKRAEAQISGILAQRVAAQLREPARAAQRATTLAAVAAHEIDPFSAADRLLELLRADRAED